jgi:hypothetical protein
MGTIIVRDLLLADTKFLQKFPPVPASMLLIPFHGDYNCEAHSKYIDFTVWLSRIRDYHMLIVCCRKRSTAWCPV